LIQPPHVVRTSRCSSPSIDKDAFGPSAPVSSHLSRWGRGGGDQTPPACLLPRSLASVFVASFLLYCHPLLSLPTSPGTVLTTFSSRDQALTWLGGLAYFDIGPVCQPAYHQVENGCHCSQSPCRDGKKKKQYQCLKSVVSFFLVPLFLLVFFWETLLHQRCRVSAIESLPSPSQLPTPASPGAPATRIASLLAWRAGPNEGRHGGGRGH